MADKHDLVVSYIETLYKHRELLAAAYHRSIVGKDDDKYGGRGLVELNQARALIPYTGDGFRLASKLTQHLNEVLQAEHLYTSVGADAGDLAARLPLLADSVAKAALEGRNEDADEYIDQFDRAVFELSDSLGGALQFLRVLADNKFANVSSYAEKRRQNEFYLNRVRRINDALVAIQMNGLIDTLESMPEGDRLLVSYRSQIVDHMPEWRSQILDITAILQEYLFRTRQIEASARRMRAFALFLKRTPNYVPPDLDGISELPQWALRARSFPLRSHADVQDPRLEESLSEIARGIRSAPRVVVQPPPKAGTLLAAEPQAMDGEQDKAKAWQTAIQDFLNGLEASPCSAVAWKKARPELETLEDEIWLLCLLHEESLRRRRTAKVRFKQILAPSEPLSGMLRILDIVAERELG